MISFLKLLNLGSSPVGKVEITDCNSIAELRAINTGNNGYGAPILEDGSIVNVDGYLSQNDGGGGVFIFSAYSVAADDGGLIIAPTAGLGRWIRQVAKQPVNVKWFGAVGDGVVDDTVAIQAALNAGGKVVYLPNGTYKQTAALTIPAGTKLTGDGAAVSILSQATAATNNLNVYNVSNVTIENLGINATSAIAIHVKATTSDVEEFLARNIYIYSLGAAGQGIYLEASATKTVYFPTLQNVSVKGGNAASWGTKEGITIGTAGMVLVVGTRISGGRIWRTHHGINLVNCDTVKSFGVAMDDCDGNGIYFQGAGDCMFLGHRFETATFGKYVQFTAAAADNYVDGIPGNATTVLVTDAGTRNSWEGLDGSGGLANRFGDGPYNFRAAITCDSTFNGVTLANLGVTAPLPSNAATSAEVAKWAMGGARNGSGPGGSTTTVKFAFPFAHVALYLATAVAQSDSDSTVIATRMSLIVETSSGVFVENNIAYVHPGAAVITFAFARTVDDVDFSATYAAGGGITVKVTRNLIKLH